MTVDHNSSTNSQLSKGVKSIERAPGVSLRIWDLGSKFGPAPPSLTSNVTSWCAQHLNVHKSQFPYV